MKKIVTIFFILAIICSPQPFKEGRGGANLEYLPTNLLKSALSSSLQSENWPENFTHKGKLFKINYSFDQDLTDFIKKRIRSYGPDFVSVVVIDNNSGKILSAQDYNKADSSFGKAITFSPEHPAASVFKIITSADLLENGNVSVNTPFSFSGKSTTLYKGQIRPENSRWSKIQTLLQAFAISNNVVFGKAAIQYSAMDSIYNMAKKFGFEQSLISEIDLKPSRIEINRENFEVEVQEEDEKNSSVNRFHLAEIASGFNRLTLMSPIHGAIIASIIANKGRLVSPYLVKNVINFETQKEVWRPTSQDQKVISEETANDLKKLMQETIVKGTAKSSFAKSKKGLLSKVEVGGKTGSIRGGEPFGKNDWFVAYANPRNEPDDKGISICVLIINMKKWYIKSPLLARDIINYYYQDYL